MPTTYQIVALSSLDPDGSNTRDEPKLVFPDALKTAQGLKDQGKAFRVFVDGEPPADQIQALNDLGAIA
jgi:hypothetical protein